MGNIHRKNAFSKERTGRRTVSRQGPYIKRNRITENETKNGKRIQLLGIVSYGAWAFLLGLLTFTVIKKTIGLRVSKDEERKGLDITEHGNDAYAGFQVFMNE